MTYAMLTGFYRSTMYFARSGNSSGDELPAPGNYRQCNRRGTVPCRKCRGHLRGVWIAYSYSLYFSDQLSCINYFNPTYGLKDIEFQSFNQIKSISRFSLIFKYSIIQNSVVDLVKLTNGSHMSVDWSTLTVLDNVELINKINPGID